MNKMIRQEGTVRYARYYWNALDDNCGNLNGDSNLLTILY